MTRYTKEKLYELLPAIYRQRDAKIKEQLKELLKKPAEGPLESMIGVIAEQIEILENDIECLYDNWFIETCDAWVIPYIGDLLGAKILRQIESTPPVTSQRTYVANTIRYRQGKGTAAVLEQIARDVTGWNTRVVEFFQILATTQHLNHLRLDNARTPDLRDLNLLELLGTPFDTISHTVDVRNIKSGRGLYNIPNVGIILWRTQAYPVNHAPAFNHGGGRFTFNQLGYDMPLFNHPTTERSVMHIAEEINVPTPIRRLALYYHLQDYYASRGEEKSIKIVADDKTVSSGRIVVCDLEDWMRKPPAGKVALDPERGRLSFPSDEIPEDVHVSYYYGFSSDLGGGFYSRPGLKIDIPENTVTYKISKKVLSGPSDDINQSIVGALAKWEGDGKPDAILEILDSEFYEMPSELLLPNGKTVAIISADKQRPVLKKMPEGGVDEQTVPIIGGDGSHLVLDGLLLDLNLDISEKLDLLLVNHSTLVPSNSPSIRYKGTHPLHISLHRTICGSIITEGSEVDCSAKPETELDISDSIIDEKDAAAAVNANGDTSSSMAIGCYKIKIENSSVFGKVNAVLVDIVSNSIFTDLVRVERRQQGCMRFSYIPVGSEVPRCYRCQPGDPSDLSTGYNTCSKKVIPRFTSRRYGDAGYAQLNRYVSHEIMQGGDNGAEMGAFNHLYQPQRINNLETRLEEYLRFGLDAAILSADADNGRRDL